MEMYAAVVDREVSAEDAPKLADEIRSWLLMRQVIIGEQFEIFEGDPLWAYRPGSNVKRLLGPSPDMLRGVRIVTGRTAFSSTAGHFLFCPVCRYTFEPDEDDATDALAEWQAGGNAGPVSCPDCYLTQPITEWDSDWAYGNLGIEFHGWPDLPYFFVRELTRLLAHETVVACGVAR
ncbi:hypothetical protein GCM10022247_23880 [Allokutzneria multivorans]|uniref:Uncharacterized protein n=1 Tax=Allokutzneria multivorans TaxID=1142134 RepID=A0ABP7RU78_9PSEU